MDDEKDKKKKKKSFHPLDVWPPRPQRDKEEIPLKSRAPRNASYEEPEYPTDGELIVYDAENEEYERESEDKKETADEKAESREK